MSVGLGLTARIGTYGAFVEARMHHAYVGEDLFASAETGTLTAGLVFWRAFATARANLVLAG